MGAISNTRGGDQALTATSYQLLINILIILITNSPIINSLVMDGMVCIGTVVMRSYAELK